MIRKQTPKTQAPRFDVRQRNGVWQVFDTVWFGPVKAFRDQGKAAAEVARLNARHAAQ